MRLLTPLSFENRKSTGYLFVHVHISDEGIEKHLDVYYEKKTGKTGLEIYQGYNYVVGSNERSYSRHYPHFKGIPHKYKVIVDKMRKLLIQKIPRRKLL